MNVKNTALILALVLFLTFLSYIKAETQFAFTASAQYSELVISIRNDGSIDPSTAPIQRNGDLYTLTSDVNCNTFLIQRDNLVFNGAHHTIELFGSVSISGRENVTVTNAIIKAGLGISLSGSNNKIIGNTFHINGTAISVSSAGFTVTSGNIISNNIIELKNGYSGVDVFKTLDTVISNNTIFTAEDSNQVLSGIKVTSSHDTTVVENSINAYAIYEIAVLKYLDVTPPQGEPLSGVVRANTIAGNYSYGVYSNCPNVNIVGNHITGELQKNPDSRGIMLREDSNNNIVSQNYVANSGYGICFQPLLNNLAEGVLEFSIFENSFVNNNVQAKMSMANCSISWDNGRRGNYWSDYVGEDADDDWIGEAPYIIDADNYDNYPLIAPFEALPSPEPQPREPFQTTLVIASVITVAVVGIVLFVYFKRRKH